MDFFEVSFCVSGLELFVLSPGSLRLSSRFSFPWEGFQAPLRVHL